MAYNIRRLAHYTHSKTLLCLLIIGLVSPAFAVAKPASSASNRTLKINLPPSATLQYRILAKQSGLSINGSGEVQWQWAGKKFSVTSETRADLLGKVLSAKTDGEIDAAGLAPTTFVDKRMRKAATTTTFDRANRVIRFSTSPATYPIAGGEQDRNSIIWQLIGTARAAGATFKQGSQWQFVVAGQRDAEPWTFEVAGTEKIRTALGQFDALHVVRAAPAQSTAQKLDIWLAPGLQWYPVKLRFSESNGDFIEQTLEAVVKS